VHKIKFHCILEKLTSNIRKINIMISLKKKLKKCKRKISDNLKKSFYTLQPHIYNFIDKILYYYNMKFTLTLIV